MQHTLLGLGIALILALVTALAGPLFVDWGRYRTTFEAEASRMAGLPVRIGGAIDVRILPTPTIVLRDVEAGSRAAPVFGAQVARVELALGALMKGEWRAALLTLEAPDLSLGLDATGKVVTRNAAPGVDLDRISIDRIAVSGGNLAFEDATSGARLALEKLSVTGEIRSLAGAVKGEGGFASAGRAYKYRLATGRNTDGGLRLHFNLDPVDRPLAFETDGLVTLDGGKPQYEGTLSFVRPAGVELAGGKTVANDPWRLTGKIKSDTRKALLEQLELQYGPEERVIRLTGTADMTFGKTPDFTGVISARQVDLDRALAAADVASRLPLAALRSLTESLGAFGRVPLPVKLGIGIDSVTLGGAPLQSVRGDVKFTNNAWSIENFEFRAPGYTQVALAGRIDGTSQGAEFSGPVSLDSSDPRALLAWLEGFERARGAIAPLKLRGEVTVGKDRFVVDRVRAESDRKAFEGRLAYTYARGNQSAKLDAALSASEFDVDGAVGFFNAAFPVAALTRPGDIALAVDLGRMMYAGVEASAVKANVRLDAAGLRIEKLSIDDFGGAAVNASGQIDILSVPPRGEIAVSLNAQKIDGVAVLLRKVSPDAADTLSRYAARLAPAVIDASIKIDPQPAAIGNTALGKFAFDGKLGGLRVAIGGDVTGSIDKLADSHLKLTAKLGSEDGALLTLLGFDRLLAAGKRPANLTLDANGPAGGDLRVETRLSGDGIDGTASGTLRLALQDIAGKLAVSLAVADARGLRRDAVPLPLSFKSNVVIRSGAVAFNDLAGKAGSANINGRVARDAQGLIDGNLYSDALDTRAFVVALIGAQPPSKPAVWSSQAFAAGPLSDLRGKIDLNAAQAEMMPSVVARNLRSTMNFTPSEIAFENITASIGSGSLSGNARFTTGTGGLSARGNLAIANAEASSVIRASGAAPFRGKLSSQIEFESTGTTPAALIGALRGTGLVTLENAQITGLDVKAIDAAIRAVERGAPVAPPRITEVVSRVMDGSAYSFARASAPIEITAGRVRLGKFVVPPQAGNLAVAGSIDLVDETLDARFTLTGSQVGAGQTASQRPEISVALKGPLDAPRRTIDVSPLIGWLTLQAVDRQAKKLDLEEREAKRREQLNAEIEQRLQRLTPPPVSAPVPETPQAEAPSRRTPPGIESAPLAPIQ